VLVSPVASLAGLWLMLAFDAPMLAALTAYLFPTTACWFAGLRDPRQLAKIALYVFVGWGLTFGLQPAMANLLHRMLNELPVCHWLAASGTFPPA